MSGFRNFLFPQDFSGEIGKLKTGRASCPRGHIARIYEDKMIWSNLAPAMSRIFGPANSPWNSLDCESTVPVFWCGCYR